MILHAERLGGGGLLTLRVGACPKAFQHKPAAGTSNTEHEKTTGRAIMPASSSGRRAHTTEGTLAKTPTKSQPKAKSPLDAALTDTAKLKGRVLAIESKCANLARIVSDKDEWAWARGPALIGDLEQAAANLESEFRRINVQHLLQHDSKELKQMATPEDLLAQCRGFLGMSELISGLEAMHAKLLRMSKARASAT